MTLTEGVIVGFVGTRMTLRHSVGLGTRNPAGPQPADVSASFRLSGLGFARPWEHPADGRSKLVPAYWEGQGPRGSKRCALSQPEQSGAVQGGGTRITVIGPRLNGTGAAVVPGVACRRSLRARRTGCVPASAAILSSVRESVRSPRRWPFTRPAGLSARQAPILTVRHVEPGDSLTICPCRGR